MKKYLYILGVLLLFASLVFAAKRSVVAEMIGSCSGQCANCNRLAFNAMCILQKEKGKDCTTISWYKEFASDLYYERKGYYNYTTEPVAKFDGVIDVYGKDAAVIEQYRSAFDKRTSISSPLEITLYTGWKEAGKTGYIKAVVTVDSKVNTSNNKIHFIVYEKNKQFGCSTYEISHCARERVYSNAFLLVNPQETETYETFFEVKSGWNCANLGVASIVQSDDTKEILQGIFNEEWNYYSVRKMTFGEIKKLYK